MKNKTALSPSLTNFQFPPADAGRLTGVLSSFNMTSKLPSATAPSTHVAAKLSTLSTPARTGSVRRKTGRKSTMKRTTSTASIMDTVISSQAPSDHDVQTPHLSIEDPSVQPAASSTANVLLTPRRGRRLGKINMGWESPLLGDNSASDDTPHTLPKSKTWQDFGNVTTKRKVSTAFASELQDSHRSLIDTAGRASAAMLSSVALTEHELSSSPGLSPRDLQSQDLAFSSDNSDLVAAFVSPLLPQDPKLVPMDVQGLGRVAVHRDFAQQISEHGPVSGLAPPRRYSSGGLCRGSDSGDSSSRSDVGSSTDPTSVGTPCPGVSPSFSLSSQFPCSEPPSPAKRSDLRTAAETVIEARGLLTTTTNAASLAESATWRPRLRGHHRATNSLPTLDWPDSPDGPWSAAGKHVFAAKEKRRENLARWLEADTEGDLDAQLTLHAYQHHPMVAKALLDRARKREDMVVSTAAASMPSPAKRAKRFSAIPAPSKRRGRKPRVSTASALSNRKTVATGASLARSHGSAVHACKCGIDDDAIIMVQCDNCKHWLHLPCVGINSSNELEDEWYCDTCCDAAMTEHLSPASSLQTSYADFTTPEGLQALLSGQEPVFTLPSGTPHRHGLAVSSSIALAPSPTLLSVSDAAGRSTVKRQGLGRSRAERVGWRINEPGSPLARKSTTGSAGVRSSVPDTPIKIDFSESNGASSLLAGWEPMRSTSGSSSTKGLLERPMTPSPRLVGISTPSRHASGRKPSGPLSLGYLEEEAVHADVFSTPSRLASGGAWSYRGGQQQYSGNLTPSRSGGRHQRVDSFIGGMYTPGRDFLSSAFATEPSTSMPSLMYSSGYDHGLEEHIGGGEHYSSSRAWQLQSPTSATRAVRARQTSGLGTPWSSAQLKTPELQPRVPNTSCMRGRFDSSDDVPPSSSPFPRTPTFDFGSPRFMQRYPGGGDGHERHPSNLGNGLPTSHSSARLHKAMAGEPAGNRHPHLDRGAIERNVSSGHNSAGKNRQVSSEVPLGLGIGLDLDDVLDWS